MDLRSPDLKCGMTVLVLSHLLHHRPSLPARPSESIIYKTSVHTRCKSRISSVRLLNIDIRVLCSSSFYPTHGIARRPKLAHLSSRLVSHPATSSDSPQRTSPALGNLYLSSCPGKKGSAFHTCRLLMFVLLTPRGESAPYWASAWSWCCLSRSRTGPPKNQGIGCWMHRLVLS